MHATTIRQLLISSFVAAVSACRPGAVAPAAAPVPTTECPAVLPAPAGWQTTILGFMTGNIRISVPADLKRTEGSPSAVVWVRGGLAVLAFEAIVPDSQVGCGPGSSDCFPMRVVSRCVRASSADAGGALTIEEATGVHPYAQIRAWQDFPMNRRVELRISVDSAQLADARLIAASFQIEGKP